MWKIIRVLDLISYYYCHALTTHPYISFAIGFTIHLLFVVITAVIALIDSNEIFPTQFNSIPLFNRDEESYQCFRMFNTLSVGNKEKSLANAYIIHPVNMFYLYYYAVDNNILTSENLKRIQTVENEIFAEFMKAGLCFSISGVTCDQVLSVISLLLSHSPNDQDFLDIDSTINGIVSNEQSKLQFESIVSSDFEFKDGKSKAKAVRTNIRIIFYDTDIINKLDKSHKDYAPFFLLYYDNYGIVIEFLIDAIFQDMYLIPGCFLFIFLFTWFQTKSFFITFFGILSIFTSFICANVIYAMVIGIKFFGFFHILSTFLLLGIGCDNIYVFFDRWKSNQFRQYDTLTDRLIDIYRGVGWSMFITSVTTAMAFFVLIWTPLLFVSTFGTFVTLLVITNYISVSLYFPIIVIIYHLKFENVHQPDKIFLAITDFFHIRYFNFLMWKYVKYIILGIFAAIAIAAAALAAQIKVAEKFPTLLTTATQYGQMDYLRSKYFDDKHIDTNLEVLILNGPARMNFDGCSYWEINCQNGIIFDENLVSNRIEVQMGYQKICDELLSLDSEMKKKLKLFDNANDSVFCITVDMDQYFKNKFPSENFQVPWTKSKFLSLINLNPGIYGNVILEPEYPVSYESAIYYFLSDGLTFSDTGLKMFKRHGDLHKFNPVSQYRKQYFNSTFSYGYYMNFTAVLVNLTILARSTGFTEKTIIFQNWREWHSELKKSLPFQSTICGSQYDTSGYGYFHWVYIQKVLCDSAIKGVIFGLIVIAIILCVATLNYYNAIIIFLGTCLSTLSVVSIIKISKWDFGLIESLVISIVVGLTVDFLVHMGLSYNASPFETREDKTKFMLQQMGVSMISGMLTTLGSAFFLLFCSVTFLQKFGIFVFVTIFSAGIYSMIFLPVVFLVFGPQGRNGDVKFWSSPKSSYVSK